LIHGNTGRDQLCGCCGEEIEQNPLSLKRLLIPAPDDLLRVQPASSLVNNPKNDGPELLIPTAMGETLELFPTLKNSL